MNDTAAEITSQPDVWLKSLALTDQAQHELIAPGERMLVLGCGTSWFVAQALADTARRHHKPAEIVAIQSEGGTIKATEKGIRIAQAFAGTLATQDTPAPDVIEEPIVRPAIERSLASASVRPTSHANAAARVAIVSPESNAHFLHDPDLPPDTETIALRASVIGPFRDVIWYVDDHLYGTASGSDTLRWPLQQGIHRFQARLAGRPESSPVITVTVE